MRIIYLEKAQRGLVLHLDPLMMLDRLGFPGSMAFVAIEPDEERKDELPVGLLIASMQGKQMTVDWLYVDPSKRMRGIGEALLIAAYEHAHQAGAEKLCAYLNEEYGRDQICSNEDIYLREHLFLKEEKLGGEWVTDIRTLAMKLQEKEKTATRTDIISFRKLNIMQASETIRRLQRMEACEALYTMEEKERYYDPGLSVMLTDGKQVNGGFLMQCIERSIPQIAGNTIHRRKETVLYPVLCCAQCEQDLLDMMSAVLKSALANYNYGTEVRIILKTDRYTDAVDRLAPGLRTENRQLVARVEDYIHAQEEDAGELGMRRLLQLG